MWGELPRPAELDAALPRPRFLPSPVLAAIRSRSKSASPPRTVSMRERGGLVVSIQASFNGRKLRADFTGLTGLRECVSFSAMGPRAKQPVVICPRCRRRMATKEHKPVGPKQRKAIKFSDSLVEVAYVCESCGTEIKRTIREK